MYMSGVSVSTLFTNERHLQKKKKTFGILFAFLEVAKAYDSDALRNWHPPKILELIKLLYGDTRKKKMENSPIAA